jgi:hypothetical protein
MTPEETFGQVLGLRNLWRGLEAVLEAISSSFMLKVEETAALWPEESARFEIRGGLPRPCRAQALAASQFLQQGVRNRICAAAGATQRRRHGVPCDSALSGAQ